MPLEFGATHYVGVAGVGLDAATYKRGDPATAHKRGVFSYDGAASVTEIMAGRGTSNTVMMIQVPHDRGAGVTPWIAGGGATVRGVPEKNSVEPFSLGKDRSGKSIGEKGTKGTFVLMADGTVRFVGQDVSDEVFKAMCTIEGPAPEKFNLKSDRTCYPAPDGRSGEDSETKSSKTPEKSGDESKTRRRSPATKIEDTGEEVCDNEDAGKKSGDESKTPEKVEDTNPRSKTPDVKPATDKATKRNRGTTNHRHGDENRFGRDDMQSNRVLGSFTN